MPDYTNQIKSNTLTLPSLHKEVEPTQTDMRAIQRWGQQQPQTALTSVAFGRLPPQHTQLTDVSEAFTFTFIGASQTLDFKSTFGFTFSYGYNVNADILWSTSGDLPYVLFGPIAGTLQLRQLNILTYDLTTSPPTNYVGTLTIMLRFIGA